MTDIITILVEANEAIVEHKFDAAKVVVVPSSESEGSDFDYVSVRLIDPLSNPALDSLGTVTRIPEHRIVSISIGAEVGSDKRHGADYDDVGAFNAAFSNMFKRNLSS